jgi:hypothetical protein
LQFLGNPVVSVFGSQAAKQLDLMDKDIGAILIGHGAPWEERSQLISHSKRTLPGIPVIASLRQSDKFFENADFNCPADNPPRMGTLGPASTGRNELNTFAGNPEDSLGDSIANTPIWRKVSRQIRGC